MVGRREEQCWPGPDGGGEEVSVGAAAGVPSAGPDAGGSSALAGCRVRTPQQSSPDSTQCFDGRRHKVAQCSTSAA